jgi:TPR repeat protein
MKFIKREDAPQAENLFNQADKYEEKGDFRRAFDCYLTAAKLGDSWGQVNLGNYYAAGKGVMRSLEKAAHWYKKAYRNGNSCGALNLAVDKRNQGNIRSALVWFQKAVAMNNGDAHLALAKIYTLRGPSGEEKATSLL